MAHPYANKAANKVASQTARERVKGYDSGGSVSALHPGGTFARNSDKTDTHTVLRKALGMPDPPSAPIIPLAPRPKASGGAAKYARGGKVKKPSVEINIISPSAGGPSSSTLPALPPVPRPPAPMLPPGGGPSPGGPPMGGLPPVPPSPGVPGMKRGGRIKMTGGAEGGLGRIQKAKNAKVARGG